VRVVPLAARFPGCLSAIHSPVCQTGSFREFIPVLAPGNSPLGYCYRYNSEFVLDSHLVCAETRTELFTWVHACRVRPDPISRRERADMPVSGMVYSLTTRLRPRGSARLRSCRTCRSMVPDGADSEEGDDFRACEAAVDSATRARGDNCRGIYRVTTAHRFRF
jgi:hypothetical protein